MSKTDLVEKVAQAKSDDLVDRVGRAIATAAAQGKDMQGVSRAAIAMVLRDQMKYAEVAQILNVQRFIEMIARENGISL